MWVVTHSVIATGWFKGGQRSGGKALHICNSAVYKDGWSAPRFGHFYYEKIIAAANRTRA